MSETAGYVLDGIPTAMVADSMITGGLEPIAYGVRVTCACGWVETTNAGQDFRPRLRFHFAHCPAAKVRERARPAQPPTLPMAEVEPAQPDSQP